jgi:hypothetical protein
VEAEGVQLRHAEAMGKAQLAAEEGKEAMVELRTVRVELKK